MNKQPLVSVVVTTKNEEKNIGRCLESIRKQTYPQEKIEVIVVDNNSTDRTREIARKYTKRVYNFPSFRKLLKIKNQRGAQLNFGVSKSKGTIIFFPDADMTFSERLLEEAVEIMKKDDIDALYIPEIIIGRGYLGKVRNFERSFYNQTCIDAVRIVRKSIFLKVGGFDETIDFGPDDWDFTKTLKTNNFKFGLTTKKLYHHEEQITWKSYINKKNNYTYTFKDYINKWSKYDSDVKKQLGFCYRYFGVFTEKGKWKKLLRHPLLLFGLWFLRILIGLNYLKYKILR